jgi:hypothetical protein
MRRTRPTGITIVIEAVHLEENIWAGVKLVSPIVWKIYAPAHPVFRLDFENYLTVA